MRHETRDTRSPPRHQTLPFHFLRRFDAKRGTSSVTPASKQFFFRHFKLLAENFLRTPSITNHFFNFNQTASLSFSESISRPGITSSLPHFLNPCQQKSCSLVCISTLTPSFSSPIVVSKSDLFFSLVASPLQLSVLTYGFFSGLQHLQRSFYMIYEFSSNH